MAEKTGKSVGDVLKLFAASAPQNRLIAPDEVAALALLIAIGKNGGHDRSSDQRRWRRDDGVMERQKSEGKSKNERRLCGGGSGM
ncbi:MAG TPA: hypothetical protein VMT22_11070 [Terriglobales bacterium]|nr:hypothetical protein [Terriglobales bacterium]